MCTAHVFPSMFMAAGTGAEFGLATIAAVILSGTAVSKNTLAACSRPRIVILPGLGAAHSSLAGESAVASTSVDRSTRSGLPGG